MNRELLKFQVSCGGSLDQGAGGETYVDSNNTQEVKSMHS